MNSLGKQLLTSLSRILVSPGLEPEAQASRLQTIERDVVLPIKGFLAITLVYYFYFSNWLTEAQRTGEVALDTIRALFISYVIINIGFAAVLISVRRLRASLLQWMLFVMGLMDALLLAALIMITNGFSSILYWVFLVIIIHNAIAIPLATPQIVLNLAVVFFYFFAGMLDMAIKREEASFQVQQTVPVRPRGKLHHGGGKASGTNLPPRIRPLPDVGFVDSIYPETATEPVVLRVTVLILMTISCYGLQALIERQKKREEEAAEFLVRQEQLQTAGRLAAEIAHQIKNPLAIISNAAWSLQRASDAGKKVNTEQIDIIREEVSRADRIITELMGYAQLAEGRVEKLDVIEEMERAISRAFPSAANYKTVVKKNFAPDLPQLTMQRNHLGEAFVNILQNAREAMQGKGQVNITIDRGPNYSVVVTIADTGPGIPRDRFERVFESYFSTKEKGTGLGLAIVKHNVEIYGGSIKVESELGKGAKFILQIPSRTLLKISK